MYELNVKFYDSVESRFVVSKADLDDFNKAIKNRWDWCSLKNEKTGWTNCLKPNDVKMFNYKEVVETED